MRLDLKEKYRMRWFYSVFMFVFAAATDSAASSVGFAGASIYKQFSGAAAAEQNLLCHISHYFSSLMLVTIFHVSHNIF